MQHVQWSVPTHQMDPRTARDAIFAQHVEIRTLLEAARVLADAALDQKASSPDAVASAIGDIRTAIEVHLAFEEGVLIPQFKGEGSDGETRARRLVSEHTHQRAVLANLHKEATSFPRLPMLAAKLAFLSAWLLADMTAEEQSLGVDPL